MTDIIIAGFILSIIISTFLSMLFVKKYTSKIIAERKRGNEKYEREQLVRAAKKALEKKDNDNQGRISLTGRSRRF